MQRQPTLREAIYTLALFRRRGNLETSESPSPDGYPLGTST
jgi:hypothetical protein